MFFLLYPASFETFTADTTSRVTMSGFPMTQLALCLFLALLVHVHSQCLTVLTPNCRISSVPNDPLACCPSLACFRGLCLPCLPAGSSMMCTTGQCCAGAICSNGRCVASTFIPPPNDPVAVPAPTTQCVALLTSGCQVGVAPGTATACCSGSTCSAFDTVCYPCLAQNALCFQGSSSRCCDGLFCSGNRCQPSGTVAATPLPNDPVAATPAPTTPQCVALLTSGCQVGAAPGTATACCSGSTCSAFDTVCYPCLAQNALCFQGSSSRCCDGLFCSGNRCQPSGTAPATTPAPAPAPLDPTNCRPLNSLGCDDTVTSLKCCSGSYCNFARACLQCIEAGNTTTCVANAQDTRRCCEGLTCVGGLCQALTTGPTAGVTTGTGAPLDPTATPALATPTQAPGSQTATQTPSQAPVTPPAPTCSQLGAQCSAASPCCPGGLTCSPITGTCDFVVVGRRAP